MWMVILKKSQLQSGLDEGPGGGGGGGGTPLFGLSTKRLCARRLFVQGSVRNLGSGLTMTGHIAQIMITGHYFIDR